MELLPPELYQNIAGAIVVQLRLLWDRRLTEFEFH